MERGISFLKDFVDQPNIFLALLLFLVGSAELTPIPNNEIHLICNTAGKFVLSVSQEFIEPFTGHRVLNSLFMLVSLLHIHGWQMAVDLSVRL